MSETFHSDRLDGMAGSPEGVETYAYLAVNTMVAAHERYERSLVADSEKALKRVLEAYSDDEVAAWTATNTALIQAVAEDVTKAARAVAGPIWSELGLLQNGISEIESERIPLPPESELSDEEKTKRTRQCFLAHFYKSKVASYSVNAHQHFDAVLSSGSIGEDLHEYAYRFIREDGYEQLQAVRIWQWFGGYLAYTGVEPPDDGEEYEFVGALADGNKVYRPANVAVKYLNLIATDLWLRKWHSEAKDRKRDHDESMARMHKTAPRALTHVPLPADKSSVDIALSVNAGTSAALARGARVEPVPTEIIIDWGDDSEPLQLVLPFDGAGTGTGGPLVQVNRHFGDSRALSFLLSAITAHWTSGAEPDGTFPVYADELAWLMGLERLDFNKQVERFSKAVIHAKYEEQEIVAPFLQMTLKRKGRGGRVDSGMAVLHPVLTYAVAAGGQYWPASIEILQTSTSTSRFRAESQALAVLVANQFSTRAGGRRPARFSKLIGGEKGLASVLGYGNQRPARQRRYIERAAKDLHEIGFLGDYEVVEGVTGLVLNASPGDQRDTKPKRPARLPHTGHTLRQWCSANGGITASTSLLGVSRSYLHKQVARGHSMVSSRMRRSLREYLWPDQAKG